MLRYFYNWRDGGLLRATNHVLVMAVRELEGCEPSSTAGVIDSRGVRTTESGGPRGFVAGKRVKGCKRHIATDTLGLMVGAVVHPADVQDRDRASLVLRSIRHSWPWLRHAFANGGYAGPMLRDAMQGHGDRSIEIIKRSDTASGFEVLPRRWVIERTFAWLSRSRRHGKDWEATTAISEAWLLIAHIRIFVRRLARFHAPPVEL